MFALAVLLPTSASAQITIHVPADQPTIQAGIDAAQNGDTVLVAPGTYHEHLDFHGKLITVASASGPETTIIDGDLTATVVRFHTSETVAAVLHGFTIRNGKEAGSAFTSAGGISIQNASPTIRGNVIVDNQGCDGDGISVYGGSPLIQINIISRNKQTTCSGGNGGGGIGIVGGNNTQVIGNIITDNVNYAFGGGIAMNGGGTAHIEDNYIAHNNSSEGGGVALINGSSPTFVNNIIAANTASTGGGVYYVLPSGAKPVFLNNIFADNDSPNTGTFYGNAFDTVLVTNNIIVAKPGQIAVNCFQFNSTLLPVFSYNDVYSLGGSSYAGICPDQTGQNGNISTDPKFSNPAAGDYHLAWDSPAIDVGNSAASGITPTDYDQNPRIVAGHEGGDAAIDLGALEYQGPTTMTVAPSSLSFSSQKTGTTGSPQVLTVTNTGTRTLRLKAFSVGADFAETDDCVGAAGVAPGSSCSINVVFSPGSAGQHSESIIVAGSNVLEAPTSVDLNGFGTAPVASLSTASLNFAGQMLYTTSAAQQVTLTNIGDADMVVSGITISGDFAQTNNCTATLAPNAACTISVTFTPTVTQTRTGVITIADDATGAPHGVSLSGTGIGPEISFSPAPVYFLPQSVGTLSNPLTVTVSNTGGYGLVISAVQVSGDYSIQASNCVATIAAGANCQVSLQFLPTTTGARLGSLTFTDNASGSPQTVALSGQGTAPMLQILSGAPFPAAIYTATTSQKLVSLKNVGSEPLVISFITTTGSSFSQTNTCSAPVAPNAACGVTITFTPQAIGTLTGTLQVVSNAIGGTATLNLSATALAGYPAPTLTSISPAALQIGSNSSTLAATGTNFYPTTTILLDGQPLPTTFVTSQQVTASLSAGLASDYGEHTISVATPAPGGGTSASLPLLVYRSVAISARDLIYDRFRRVFYASVAATSPQHVNTVIAISPGTGTVTPLVDLGSEGNQLAISDDGHYLYVGVDAAGAVKRIDLYASAIDLTIPLGSSPFFGTLHAGDIFVLPGAPRSIAVALFRTGVSPAQEKLTIFDDAVPRAKSYSDGYPSYVVSASDPGVLYTSSSGISPPTLTALTVDPSGLSLLKSQWNSGTDFLVSDGTYLYSYAAVFDPATLLQAGLFSFNSNPAPSWISSVYVDRGLKRAYFSSAVSPGVGLWAGDTQTRTTSGPILIPISGGTYGNVYSVGRWSSDGLAFRYYTYSGLPNAGDQIVFLRSRLTNPSGTNPTPLITSFSPSSVPMHSENVVVSIQGEGFVPASIVRWNGEERSSEYVDTTHLKVFLPATDFSSVEAAQITVFNPPQGGGSSAAVEFGVTNPTPAQLSTTSVDFGSQFVWLRGPGSNVTITNPGASALAITAVNVTGGFSQSNDCGTALAAFSTCTVSVRFTPASVGPATGTLTVQYDLLTAPSTVALSGVAQDVTLSLTRLSRPARPDSGHSAAGEAEPSTAALPPDIVQPPPGFAAGAPLQLDAATMDLIVRVLDILAEIDSWRALVPPEKPIQ